MRLLHISSGNLYGGVEAMLLTMATSEARCPTLEMDVALCFDGRASRELAAHGARLHRLPTPRARMPPSVLRARQALVRLLRDRAFDRVICHGQWSQAIFGPAVRRAGVPLVMWVHGPLTGRHWSERWAGWTRPDLAICTSEFTARSVSNLYDGLSVVVVHPPVELPSEPLAVVERGIVRRELDTAAEAVVIVQASRMEAWKGHALLIEALALLRDLPDWICWQIGGAQRPFEERHLESVRKQVAECGLAHRVRFVGERPDVRRLLAAADVHCQANLAPEPFGIAFIEALAAGLPVVTMAMGGAVEIVDQSCGILVPPADPISLARALRRLIEDPVLRARLSAAAPARAKSVSDVATQLRLMKDALEGMAVSVGV